MIKVTCDKGATKLEMKGSVAHISAEMICIIKAVYDTFKEENEQAAEDFKACMLRDLEDGGPFKTTEQLKDEAKGIIASLLDKLLDRLMDEPDEEN